jgi:hypothetical protein
MLSLSGVGSSSSDGVLGGEEKINGCLVKITRVWLINGKNKIQMDVCRVTNESGGVRKESSSKTSSISTPSSFSIEKKIISKR